MRIILLLLFFSASLAGLAQNHYSKGECDTNIIAPNVKTPNGDGIDRDFMIVFKHEQPKVFEMKIYDRWGKVTFVTHSPDKGWNGNEPIGKEYVSQGTYFWYIKYRYKIGGEELSCVGTITVIR
jgi:gliding motility-associated-like protein